MLAANNNQLPPDMKEFAYHRYCAPTGNELQSVANLRTQYNINTAQLEHGGADYNELHADLKIAKVSSWQQFTVAFCTADDGYQHYVVNGNTYTLASRSKFLRQYFKYVRRGAVRIGATTSTCDNHTLCTGSFDPIAFKNTNGTFVVIIKTTATNAFTITNLPNGVYGIKYTTGIEYDKNLPDQTITNGLLTTSIPGAGVITIYGKTTSNPVPTNTAGPTVPPASPSPTPTGQPTITPQPTLTGTPSPTIIITDCLKKSTGDANCDGLIQIADFEIWRKEFFAGCNTSAINTCGPNDDQLDTAMDADFNNLPETTYSGAKGVALPDFEIWRKGFFATL